jgi:hypothetical protein
MTVKTKAQRGAVMQFEVDRERLALSVESFHKSGFDEKPIDRIYNIAKTAACDTIFRGGTFVLVVTPDKITMIQRPDAEDI